MHYARVLAAVAATPWAIEPNKGRAVAEFLSRKAAGQTVPQADIDAAVAARREPSAGRPAKNVAVVPIYGVLTQRADLVMEYSGGTSADETGRIIDALAADPRVDVIVLDVDSPGGSVAGIPELAARVAAAREVKKVIAVANAVAASAAYWIASQASELIVTPSGMVGSIGVFTMHVDRSKSMETAGVAVTLVSAGELKTDGNEFQPLSATARESMQRIVDGYYEPFVRDVAKGRGATPGAVRAGFGRGDMVLARDAVKEGMADRVATLDEVLARYAGGGAVAARAADDRHAAEARRRRMKLS